MNDWNSTQYIKFERERTQPSIDLLNRIDINPTNILDIGCGPGNSTAQLKNKFPKSNILGVDSSENMLEKAVQSYKNLNFKKANIPYDLDSLGEYDLIFSNACLHWIPDHNSLLPSLIDKLNKNGALAVQMPLVQYAPFYKILNRMIDCSKWNKLKTIQNFYNLYPDETYNILSKKSKDIQMWETTYYHIVKSYDDVISWYKGSGLRPYLNALDENEQKEFIKELLNEIKNEFSLCSDGNIILKMPRMFFIAKK